MEGWIGPCVCHLGSRVSKLDFPSEFPGSFKRVQVPGLTPNLLSQDPWMLDPERHVTTRAVVPPLLDPSPKHCIWKCQVPMVILVPLKGSLSGFSIIRGKKQPWYLLFCVLWGEELAAQSRRALRAHAHLSDHRRYLFGGSFLRSD